MRHNKFILRQELNEEFKKKGIYSIVDKRRILRDALGSAPTFSSMIEEEFQRVIDYLKQKKSEDLKSKIIAWVHILENGEGMNKKKIKMMIDLMPSDIELIPFKLKEAGTANMKAIGYINKDFYETRLEMIRDTLAAICNSSLVQGEDVFELYDGSQIKVLF